MMNKPPPVEGLNIRILQIPIVIPLIRGSWCGRPLHRCSAGHLLEAVTCQVGAYGLLDGFMV